MRIAIVTGASSGLGREFVAQIDRRERLDEIWVIARREELLREMATQTATPLRPLALDLARPDSFEQLANLLESHKPDVALLVNAAGFGRMGGWQQVSGRDNDGMIELNCAALVRMTTLCLPYMHKGGRILQVCSSSAFQPVPYLSVYAATKAFVLSYSRALWWELIGQGINCTAVCPYWIKGTEFIGKAQQGDAKVIRHFPLASHPRSVARLALWESALGLAVASAGPVALVQRFFAKFLPHILVETAWEGIRRV